MNKQFKNEFKNLNASELREIINRCAGQEILQNDFVETIKKTTDLYYIKYIEDEDYGFWSVQWGWKNTKFPMSVGGYFQYGIKITPFKIEFENTTTLNPYCRSNNQKQLEDYLHIYINKKCPHYKQVIVEETKKFISMLDKDDNIITSFDNDEFIK